MVSITTLYHDKRKDFFGSNIRFFRERRKLTQEDFAEQLGFTRVKLAAIEARRTENPTAMDLIKFSNFSGFQSIIFSGWIFVG